ncbi:SCP2 sterol-binding domain-containing protein [Ornithinibacillus contaminans]|uniref:SCP2 sterol-binding domain-containing protein n=1 Tax=Ornithinibacillus contaminans TaxID=694055 RepID=UPI00069F4AFE|nr:SCP2 sterol-binding domain-containing protein [Ornithinibacillus contaminans]
MQEFIKPNTEEVVNMIHAALVYDPAATKGKEGVYQFNLTGEDGGTFQMIIEPGNARAINGVEKEPDVVLTLDADDLKNLVAGTLNPTAAFMSGKLKIKGNMGLALKLQTVLHSFSF